MCEADIMDRGDIKPAMLTLPKGWERLLLRISFAVFALLIAAVAVAKQGVRWPQIVVWRNSAGLLPEASAEPLSYGFRLIGFLLGFSNSNQYLVVAAVVSIFAVLAIAYAMTRNLADPTHARVALVLAVSGPIVWSMASNLGRVDALLVLGSALLVASRKNVLGATAATAVMVLAHPEQALVAAGCLLALSSGPAFRTFRRSSLVALGCALLGNFTLWALAATADAPVRQDQLFSLFGASLGRFLTFAPLALYSGLGVVLMISVFAIISSHQWKDRLAIGAALLIPLLVSAITLDQTRVFVGVSTAAVLALIVTVAEPLVHVTQRLTNSPIAFWLIVTTLLPAVHIAFSGELVAPLRELYEWIIY